MKNLQLMLLCAGMLMHVGCVTTNAPVSHPKPPRKSLNIQRLIDQAEDGSTVTIPFGEYRFPKSIEINNRKNLVITGKPGTRILVEDTEADVLSIQNSHTILIKNLYLRHVVPLEEYECHGAVLRVKSSRGIKILNCELNGCGAIGIAVEDSREIMIRNCFVHHNSFNAFYFDGCDEMKIQSSIVEDNGNFIQMYRTESLEMRDNILRRNGGYWKSFHDPNPGLKKELSNN